MSKTLHFLAGVTVGAAIGVAAGLLLAPRSGSETRDMMSDAANDAWDSAHDAYDQAVFQARASAADLGSVADVTSDELRAKVDQARERMDQLREQLNDAIAGSSSDFEVEVEIQSEPAAEAAEA